MDFSLRPLSCSVGTPSGTVGPWKNEIYAVAKKIAGATERPLWILANGGLMGEVMVRAFAEQDLHVSVFTVVTSPEQEKRAEQFRVWCREHAVVYETALFDADHFYNRYIPECVSRGFCARRVQTYFQKYLMDEVEARGGVGVLGGGSLHFIYDGELRVCFDSDDALLAQGNHETHFFVSTPEVVCAYLGDPLVRAALARPEVFRAPESARYLRALVARSAWPMIGGNRKMSFYESDRARFQQAAQLLQAHSIECVQCTLSDLCRA